jgi:hypothetical protein
MEAPACVCSTFYQTLQSKERAAADGGRGEEKEDLYGKHFFATDLDPVEENRENKKKTHHIDPIPDDAYRPRIATLIRSRFHAIVGSWIDVG